MAGTQSKTSFAQQSEGHMQESSLRYASGPGQTEIFEVTVDCFLDLSVHPHLLPTGFCQFITIKKHPLSLPSLLLWVLEGFVLA